MVATWVVMMAVALTQGPLREIEPAQPKVEVIPLYKVPGPDFRLPCRLADHAREVTDIELWVSRDGGRIWSLAGTLRWSEKEVAEKARKEFEFHSMKPGEYWFAPRVKYRNGQSEPARTADLVCAQRVIVTAGYEPANPKVALTAPALDELDNELNRVEMELIRKEIKRLAESNELTPQVQERIDRLRSRLKELRLQIEVGRDPLIDPRLPPPPTAIPDQPPPIPEPLPSGRGDR